MTRTIQGGFAAVRAFKLHDYSITYNNFPRFVWKRGEF